MRRAALLAVLLFGWGCFLGACRQGLAAADIFARKLDCALENKDLPPAQLLAKCAIDPKDAQDILIIVSHEKARLKAGVCKPDAGTDSGP